jgi:Protein of unknown function (DUF2695)
MDERSMKRLNAQNRRHLRNAAAALPLPIPELDAMFQMLSSELETRHCDHSRRLTRVWLESRGHDVQTVFAWLERHGGFCDCEVLFNVEDTVEEAKLALHLPN